MSLLPVVPAHALAASPEQQRWLIEGLWADQAVGLVGGQPKSNKSILSLEMAVAVAAGTPCLRRFLVPSKGRVLLYAAEDALPVVRERLEGICRAAQVHLPEIDIQVITAPSLRLDLPADCERLDATVAALRPRLLILDPFVRLHRRDENLQSEVVPLLAFLRDLQRSHALAVLVVHHARKGSETGRAGQELRGSSEFHAWGDSNLFLRRRQDRLTLTAEHRAAAGFTDLPLALSCEDGISLQVVEAPATAKPALAPSLADKVELALAQAPGPLRFSALRVACRARTARLCSVLDQMRVEGRLFKTPAGYALVKV